jgi:predicted porin
MKKFLLVIAVAASMSAPAVVTAAPTIYGNVHLSINSANSDNNVGDVPGGPIGTNKGSREDLQMSSNTSAIGLKGSEDLGDGLKAIYKLEFGVDILGKADSTPDDSAANEGSGTLTGRDQFVGIKSSYGTGKWGTMSSNYKQMGGKIDPLYRTPLEGRGFMDIQSSRHSGRGVNRGRMTNTMQYTSPKFAGAHLVLNRTVSGSSDETTGVGLRWSNKSFMAFADYIAGQAALNDSIGAKCNSNSVANGAANACAKSHSVKGGGSWHNKKFAVAGQYESAQTDTGADYIFASAIYNINKNNSIVVTGGQSNRAGTSNDKASSVAVAYNHKLSKLTNMYAGYGAKSDDRRQYDESILTVGIKKKF